MCVCVCVCVCVCGCVCVCVCVCTRVTVCVWNGAISLCSPSHSCEAYSAELFCGQGLSSPLCGLVAFPYGIVAHWRVAYLWLCNVVVDQAVLVFPVSIVLQIHYSATQCCLDHVSMDHSTRQSVGSFECVCVCACVCVCVCRCV